MLNSCLTCAITKVSNMIFEIQKEFDKGELTLIQIAKKYGIPFVDVCTIRDEYMNQSAEWGFVEVQSYEEVRFLSRGE